eukprot:Skav225053  [mRNA]  locus=scaffold1570:242169:254928:- [translate_table: standard]
MSAAPGTKSSFSVGNESSSMRSAKLPGVQLPCPLWEAVRVASGFALLAVLAPVTIYSWSLAVPLTILCVPSLVMVRPMNLRKRPFRSLILFVFLAGNAFLLFVHPAQRSSLLSHLDQFPAVLLGFYEKTIVPAVPRNAQKFLPWQLVQWLQQAARDYKCVGGMQFPVFCFAYWWGILEIGVGFEASPQIAGFPGSDR